jgi:kinesin family protein 5
LEVLQLQNQISLLEGEILIWRSGGKVDDNEWVSFDISKNVSIPPLATQTSTETLVTSPRSISPVLVAEEEEDFLKRENELSDLLAEKEVELKEKLLLVDNLKEEIEFYKNRDMDLVAENQKMSIDMSELKLQLEKISYEHKESLIMMDSLKDINAELSTEIGHLKTFIMESQVNQPSEKDQKRAEKMNELMSDFNPSVDIIFLSNRVPFMKRNSERPLFS